MRLIDADTLIRDIEHYNLSDGKFQHWVGIQPTIEPEQSIIRCKDCKYRKVNEHYGEKGYSKLKAICELDTGDIFQLGRYAEEDDWFCADAERREGDADAD